MTLESSPSLPLMRSPISNWAVFSFPPVAVDRLGKIDIPSAAEYSSHIVLARRLLPPSIESFFVGNAL